MDDIVLNTDNMGGRGVQLHHLVPCVYAKEAGRLCAGFCGAGIAYHYGHFTA